MANYNDIPLWAVVLVIVCTVWRAFHGPYSDRWWQATTQWLRQHLVRAKR